MNCLILNNLALKQRKESTNIILSEIEELLEDYKEFEEDFAKAWLHENEDWLDDEGINESILNDMTGECLDAYCAEECYRYLHISDDAIRYMKRYLPEGSKRMVEYHTRIHKFEDVAEIVNMYLRNIINNER